MKKAKRNWSASVNCRVYCRSCEGWYNATVPREWYILHFIARPQTPVRECGHCALARYRAQEHGGTWQQWRNWERAAEDKPEPEPLPAPPAVALVEEPAVVEVKPRKRGGRRKKTSNDA